MKQPRMGHRGWPFTAALCSAGRYGVGVCGGHPASVTGWPHGCWLGLSRAEVGERLVQALHKLLLDLLPSGSERWLAVNSGCPAEHCSGIPGSDAVVYGF